MCGRNRVPAPAAGMIAQPSDRSVEEGSRSLRSPPCHAIPDLVPGRQRQHVFGKCCGIAETDAAHCLFDVEQGGGAHTEPVDTHPEQQDRARGVTCHLAAHRHRDSVSLSRVDNLFDQSNDGWIVGVEQVSDPIVATIDRQRVLNQIVRADAQEVDVARQFVSLGGPGEAGKLTFCKILLKISHFWVQSHEIMNFTRQIRNQHP